MFVKGVTLAAEMYNFKTLLKPRRPVLKSQPIRQGKIMIAIVMLICSIKGNF